MSRTDVRDLANENLSEARFPAATRADFRLFIAPEVRRGIDEHAKADVAVEICGVLVGNWGKDENGPFAAVTNYIRCENAASKFAEVTFTHESWAQINREMDSKYADARIIGWYHSHPDFGIFLSDRDTFIQEHFFGGAGQVAFVVDPVRNLEGVFAWRDGKPKPLSHYWVGEQVRTVEASERSEMGEQRPGSTANSMAAEAPRSWESSPLGLLTLLLGALSLLLLGSMYGGWRVQARERAIDENVVAGLSNPQLIGLQTQLDIDSTQQSLLRAASVLEKLPAADEKLSEKQAREIANQRKAVGQLLIKSARGLENVESSIANERGIYTRIIGFKVEEILRLTEEARKRQRQQETAALEKAEKNKKAADKPAEPALKEGHSDGAASAIPGKPPVPAAKPPADTPTK